MLQGCEIRTLNHFEKTLAWRFRLHQRQFSHWFPFWHNNLLDTLDMALFLPTGLIFISILSYLFSVDNLDNSYATDYNPTIERGQNQPHYASLNKDKLGVKKSDQIPDERVVYAELKHSGAHHPQDAYV